MFAISKFLLICICIYLCAATETEKRGTTYYYYTSSNNSNLSGAEIGIIVGSIIGGSILIACCCIFCAFLGYLIYFGVDKWDNIEDCASNACESLLSFDYNCGCCCGATDEEKNEA
jgi:hypothetical protein